MSRLDPIPGFSDVDMQALEVLVACQLETQKAALELARMVGQLAKPSPAKPRKRGRVRYRSITRHAAGDVTAEVVNEDTGRVRRYHFVKSDDGTIDVEEL